MEYQKMINLLYNMLNKPSKFTTRIWVEKNDKSLGLYEYNSDIKFKTSMIKSSSLCDYTYLYINVKITLTNTNIQLKNTDKNEKIAKKQILIKKYYLKIVLHLVIA